MAKKSGNWRPDILKLIQLVKQKPSIYDNSRPDHRDAVVQGEIWNSIAQTMGKDLTGEDWKKKWRNVRDNYVKKLREINTAEDQDLALKKVRKWPFFDILSFLDPSIADSSVQILLPESDLDLEISKLNNEWTNGIESRSQDSGTDQEMMASLPSPITAIRCSVPMLIKKEKLSRRDIMKLIHLVKQNPCVYDNSLPYHRDSVVVGEIWDKIAKAMRKDLTGDDWKKKWRNLRDNYVRKNREINTAEDNDKALKKASRWIFFNPLTFLDPFLGSNSGDDNFQIVLPDCDLDLEESGCDSEWTSSSERSQDTDNDAKVKRSSSPSLQSSSPKVRKLDTPRRSECVDPQGDLEASLLAEVVAEHRKSRQQLANHLSQSRTAEKAFFDSCALRMEKLPTPTKSILQLQICQLFFNAENPDLPPVPITPLPGQQQSLNVSN